MPLPLYGLINNVNIGNSTVYNFLDYIGEMHVFPGIKTYTQNNRFLENNIFNNFSGGQFGRYGYGRYGGSELDSDYSSFGTNRIYGLSSDKLSATDGVKLENGGLVAAALIQDRVGEYYSVDPTSTNANLNFTTEAEFEILNELIREKILGLNIHKDLFKTRYGRYSDKFVASGITMESEIGDYIVDTSFRKEYQGKQIMRKTLFEASEDSRTILTSFNYKKNNSYSEYWIDREDFTTTYKYDDSQYTDLLGISSEYRTNALIKNKEILTSFPYGVSNVVIGNELYGVGEKNVYTGTTIDKNFIGSSVVIPKGTKTSYLYYEEVDGKNVSCIRTNSQYTHDGFVANTSSMDSGSILLKKTNKLFRENKIGSLINRFHTDNNVEGSELITSFTTKAGISRGRNLLRSEGTDKSTGYDNPYCRVWTASKQYSRMYDRIRPFYDGETPMTLKNLQNNIKGFRPNKGGEHLATHSVLQDNGYVRITSQKDDSGNFEFENTRELTRYMFSIENLAWKDSADYYELPTDQQGPNGGRIMWFPPYGLSFNENVSVSWHDNDFIGRGEKIYTYTNTERDGNLDFYLLIDHPSMVDSWRGSLGVEPKDKEELEQDLLRFFAGCDMLSSTLENDDDPPKDENKNENIDNPSKEPKLEKDLVKKIYYYIFYPNNFSAIDDKDVEKKISDLNMYEMTSGDTEIDISDKAYREEILQLQNQKDENKYALNNTSGFDTHLDDIHHILGSYLKISEDDAEYPYIELQHIQKQITNEKIFGYDATKYEIDNIELYGFASSHGYVENNTRLSKHRAETIQSIIQYYLNDKTYDDKFKTPKTNIVKANNDGGVGDVNKLDAKIGRSAVAVFNLALKENITPPSLNENNSTVTLDGDKSNARNESENTSRNEIQIKTRNEVPKKVASDEYLYFSQISDKNYFVYKNIVDKIRFFDPAFHSITPEGFNGRLSFLQQCTRQGPTYSGTRLGNAFVRNAANLAFGKQPYCILRIGDFYNTKICITSISVSYDNDGVRWDLNPEGAGVQPMMAKVTINFKFIGGQDIGGPVEELQNAISENYYANTSTFNKRSTRIN